MFRRIAFPVFPSLVENRAEQLLDKVQLPERDDLASRHRDDARVIDAAVEIDADEAIAIQHHADAVRLAIEVRRNGVVKRCPGLRVIHSGERAWTVRLIRQLRGLAVPEFVVPEDAPITGAKFDGESVYRDHCVTDFNQSAAAFNNCIVCVLPPASGWCFFASVR